MSYEEFMNDISGFYDIPNVGKAWELYKQSQRALWLARAERASSEKAHYYIMSTYCKHHSNKQKWMKRISFTWEKVERKCREKAEEYKEGM